MGLMDNLKSWLGVKPEQVQEPEQQQPDLDDDYTPPEPPAVPEMPTRPEPPAPAAPVEPEPARPFDRMQAAVGMEAAEPVVEPEVDGGGDVEGDDGRFGEPALDPPDVEPEQPGQWIPNPAGPGGSSGYSWRPGVEGPSPDGSEPEGPAPEGPNDGPGPQPEPEPDRDGPAVDQLQFFEDVNPDHDMDGMDL